ncbi:hypothetical protein T440DRAFT_532924 [Plenodomus tracheiphilus IPT5]|uniref:Mid2 domain-containing protein n=1 Tax=Plenodomus tracheiphilus IPT5 TaxID=1408161 RepID=A0A6A7B6D6_9PLEO|nr:hypothetical protein T440DRAFT_532924 [Plenodomus tracheiphilus IPT5]
MMHSQLKCALLAPVVVSAAAFPWSLPEPTAYIAAIDTWGPAPTAAPQLPGFELFRRQDDSGDKICAFLSGLSQSSITCQDTAAICATNTVLGVHGCCNAAALSSCVIPTTCIPSTAMSASCTDAACSSNAWIAKCTTAGSEQCYQYFIQYSDTVMTQHGCTSSAFTLTAQRSWGPIKSSSADDPTTVTVTKDPSPTATSSRLPSSNKAAKPSIGIIVGSTIGACVFLSIIALVAFFVYRRRSRAKDHQGIVKSGVQQPGSQYHTHSMTQYDPLGSPSGWSEADGKIWQQMSPVSGSPAATFVPVYPGMGRERAGVVEVDGTQRPVEAPGCMGDKK